MLTMFQSTHVDGTPLLLPFSFSPQAADTVPGCLMVNVWWLEKGQEGAPWTGYYARLKNAKVAVELYQGIWFELHMNTSGKPTFYFIVLYHSFSCFFMLFHAFQ